MKFQLPYPNIFSSLPDGIMGLAFLVAWIDPTAFGERTHRYFVMIMLLEFITIHSSAFMAWALFAGTSKTLKIIRSIGLGLFYTLFIWAFSFDEGEWWPIWTFWLLIVNRILTVIFGDGSDASRQILLISSWGWSVMCYIVSIMLTVLLPMPELGWSVNNPDRLVTPGSGLWFDTPQTVLAAGFIYFTSVSLFELFSHRITKTFSDIDPKIPLFKEQG